MRMEKRVPGVFSCSQKGTTALLGAGAEEVLELVVVDVGEVSRRRCRRRTVGAEEKGIRGSEVDRPVGLGVPELHRVVCRGERFRRTCSGRRASRGCQERTCTAGSSALEFLRHASLH